MSSINKIKLNQTGPSYEIGGGVTLLDYNNTIEELYNSYIKGGLTIVKLESGLLFFPTAMSEIGVFDNKYYSVDGVAIGSSTIVFFDWQEDIEQGTILNQALVGGYTISTMGGFMACFNYGNGDTIPIIVPETPKTNQCAASKKYVDDAIAAAIANLNK